MTARKYAPVCSFPGCSRRHNARGLCNPHGAMQRRGEPLRPIQDRTGPICKEPLDRFVAYIALQDDGCIVWTGGKSGGKSGGGYGMFSAVGTRGVEHRVLTHRWSYEQFVGPIPEGFDIDHLCRNRACLNPDHLEPVTRAENIRRASALKTCCPAGHPYTAENTYVRPGTVHRKCRACARQRDLARAETRNAKRRAERQTRKAA